MAAFIKLSQNEWVKFFYVQIFPIQDGRIQDGCHHQVESEWMSLNQIELVWVRVLCKIAESKMAEFKMTELDGFHHQVNQIELVWVRAKVAWECFWVNLREDNKVSESKMAVSEDYMVKFKMAAIMILSQNEWVKILCANGGNQSCQMWLSLRVKTKMAEFKMAEFRMAAITKLCQNEWVKFFCVNGGILSWQVVVSLRGKTMMAEFKMA